MFFSFVVIFIIGMCTCAMCARRQKNDTGFSLEFPLAFRPNEKKCKMRYFHRSTHHILITPIQVYMDIER